MLTQTDPIGPVSIRLSIRQDGVDSCTQELNAPVTGKCSQMSKTSW